MIWEPPVVLQEVIDLATRQAADGAWQDGILANLSAQTTLPVGMSRPLIEHIGDLNRIHGRRGPVAMVVAASALEDAGRYAFLGEVTDVQETRVFRDEQEAKGWLDVRTEQSPPDSKDGRVSTT